MNIRQLVPVPVEFRLIVLATACCLFFAIPSNVDRLAAQQPVQQPILLGPVSQVPVPQLQPSRLQQLSDQQAQVPLMRPPILSPPVAQPQLFNSVYGSLVPASPSGHKPRSRAQQNATIFNGASSVRKPNQPSLWEPATPNTIESAQAVYEISSVRQRLGGGLSEQFSELTKHWRSGDQVQGGAKDPAWDELVQDGFRNEITRMANDRDWYFENAAAPNQAAYIARGSAAVKASNPGEQLRVAAKELDQMASQFETTGLYEEADQVRAQAQRFWLKSRQYPSAQPNR